MATVIRTRFTCFRYTPRFAESQPRVESEPRVFDQSHNSTKNYKCETNSDRYINNTQYKTVAINPLTLSDSMRLLPMPYSILFIHECWIGKNLEGGDHSLFLCSILAPSYYGYNGSIEDYVLKGTEKNGQLTHIWQTAKNMCIQNVKKITDRRKRKRQVR
jgi:hypothetical protein